MCWDWFSIVVWWSGAAARGLMFSGLFTGHYPTRGTGQEVFKISRAGSGRVRWSDPTRPDSWTSRILLVPKVSNWQKISSRELPKILGSPSGFFRYVLDFVRFLPSHGLVHQVEHTRFLSQKRFFGWRIHVDLRILDRNVIIFGRTCPTIRAVLIKTILKLKFLFFFRGFFFISRFS